MQIGVEFPEYTTVHPTRNQRTKSPREKHKNSRNPHAIIAGKTPETRTGRQVWKDLTSLDATDATSIASNDETHARRNTCRSEDAHKNPKTGSTLPATLHNRTKTRAQIERTRQRGARESRKKDEVARKHTHPSWIHARRKKNTRFETRGNEHSQLGDSQLGRRMKRNSGDREWLAASQAIPGSPRLCTHTAERERHGVAVKGRPSFNSRSRGCSRAAAGPGACARSVARAGQGGRSGRCRPRSRSGSIACS